MRPRKNVVAPENRKTIAYVRVSTQEQADEGVSLAAQEARIGAYCVAMGWDVPEIIRDPGKSAASLKRPGMEKVLAGVKDGGIGRIIVIDLDRLTRTAKDRAELIDLCVKHGVALVSITEVLDTSTATARLFVGFRGLISQWEREIIGERTGAALAHKRQRRTAYGRTPFGWRREDDRLVEVPAEQAALVDAHRMDREGASYREIGAMFTERGVMPHRGKAWHASSVSAVLRSKIATEAA